MFEHARIVGAFLLGLGVLTSATLRADEPPAPNDTSANAKARAEAAAKVYQGTLDRAKVDPGAALDPEKLYQWSRRWMEAEQELSDKKKDRVAAAEAHLERMKKLESVFKTYFEKGLVGPVEPAAQTYFRLEAERGLAQIKDK
jgi:hypothetical protein